MFLSTWFIYKLKSIELIFNRGYEQPPRPREERLQEVAYHFSTGILFALKNWTSSAIRYTCNP